MSGEFAAQVYPNDSGEALGWGLTLPLPHGSRVGSAEFREARPEKVARWQECPPYGVLAGLEFLAEGFVFVGVRVEEFEGGMAGEGAI